MKNLTPLNIIDIPRIDNYSLFEKNREKANEKDLEHCPICGKGLKNSQYFINSIYGGMAYPSNDEAEYNDAWPMAVGSECKKKFPKGYVYAR